MDRAETARCYMLMAATYRIEPSEAGMEAWHQLLMDFDVTHCFAATKHLCQTSRFPPTPADVIGLITKANDPEIPPSEEEAMGYYLSGEWGAHPLVAKAAKDVYWDRHQETDRATMHFRQLYRAAIHHQGRDRAREILGATNPRAIGDILAGELAEGGEP